MAMLLLKTFLYHNFNDLPIHKFRIMINTAAYESIKDCINSIPQDQIKICSIPLSVYLQEAEYLHDRASKDLDKLNVCGITKENMDDLKTRIKACRFTHLKWKSVSKEKGRNLKKWKELSPQAFALKDELIHTFLYAYRKNPRLVATIKDQKKEKAQVDMIQALKNLSVLGLSNFDKIESIGVTKETLIRASELSREMSLLLAAYHAEQGSSYNTKVLQLKAYTYTKELVDEIRLAGKYVFWKDKTRLKEYASEYVREKNKKYMKEKATSVGR